MRISTSLPAIGIATVIAFGALSLAPSSVTATDPVPTPTPVAPEEPVTSPEPTPDPIAEPVAASDTTTTSTLSRAERIRLKYLKVARVAIRQRHDRYVSGASGPNAFDCSGLVRFAYRKAEISKRLGGGHSARAMLDWARKHDKIRKRNPHVGDVVIWGNGRHAGIYIGKGRVISALNPRQDIRITGLHALGDPFTAFIRTRP